MSAETLQEARRQIEICNACRYCEGYCSVFPAMVRNRDFADGDLTHLANLCHNCRGCYYACQYTAPHEFDLNLPRALAELRQDSWEEFATPRVLGKAFHQSGTWIAAACVIGFALIFLAARTLGAASGGEGFYAHLSHSLMVAIFTPAFLAPLVCMGISLRRYWRATDGGRITINAIRIAISKAASLRNLNGGQGQGCNFEDEDRYTSARKWAHHLVAYGFLLCFASTISGTILHYGFNLKAPYQLFSLPKIFGLTGGVMLCAGCLWMMGLKHSSDPALEDNRAASGAFGFVALLFWVSLSGLLLYALGGGLVLLALHLGAVLTFFLLLPYSKMAHGFYRLAALICEETK